jgi:peptidoglycan/LPS O-acetylase OafA/YrhL
VDGAIGEIADMSGGNIGMAQPTGLAGRPDKIHALTSLRFFAALFVVLYHATAEFLPGIQNLHGLESFILLGFVSVSFFFLLSGYILGVVYLRREGPVAKGAFYKARFARVYPLFFLTLVLDTPNLFLARWTTYGLSSAVLKTAATFVGNTLMLQAWITNLRGIDNPNWSLSVETLFYLVFPLLGVALWKLRGPSLWVAAAVIYLGGQALVVAATSRIGVYAAEFPPLLHLSTFAIGILLARWQMLGRQSGGAQRPNARALWLASALAAVGFGIVVYWSPRIPSSSLCDGLLAPIFAVAIWAFSYSDWLPARLLSVPWLVVLGEASFGLYLIHIPVFHLFEHFGWQHIAALFPVYLALAISLSVVSFYFFETPMRLWIMKRAQVAHVKETVEMASDAQ